MNIFLCTLLQFASIAIILIALAFKQQSIKPVKLLGLLYLVLFTQVLILTLPRINLLSDFQWNWQGKIVGFVWLLSLIYIFKWLTPKEAGLNLPENNKWYFYAIGLGLIYDSAMLIIGFMFNDVLPPSTHLNKETILYELTMPGLEEELFYRGILWALINRYLATPIQIFKINVNWSFILTTLIFILVHWISMNSKTEKLSWSFADNYIVVLPAILLAFTRLKSKSIWPGVLLHNTINGVFLLMVMVVLRVV